MSPNAQPRSPRVTMACVLSGGGAVVVLISVFSIFARWNTLSVREQVRDALAKEPLSAYGFDAAQVMDHLKTVLMVASAVAVATLVFAIWAARRDRGARIGLTVTTALGGLAFLVTGVAGIVPAALAVFCILNLWSAEGRAWFDGRPLPERTPPKPVRTPPASGAPAPRGTPYATATLPAPAMTRRRPKPVDTAVLVTMLMAGLVFVVCGINAVAYLVSSADYRRIVGDQPMIANGDVLDQLGMDVAEFARLMFVATTVMTVLSALAMLAALWLLRRSSAARIALTVVTAIAIGISLIAFPFGWVWALGEVFVLVQLYRAEVGAWLKAPRT